MVAGISTAVAGEIASAASFDNVGVKVLFDSTTGVVRGVASIVLGTVTLIAPAPCWTMACAGVGCVVTASTNWIGVAIDVVAVMGASALFPKPSAAN